MTEPDQFFADVMSLAEKMGALCDGKPTGEIVGACMEMMGRCVSTIASEDVAQARELLAGIQGVLAKMDAELGPKQ